MRSTIVVDVEKIWSDPDFVAWGERWEAARAKEKAKKEKAIDFKAFLDGFREKHPEVRWSAKQVKELKP